MINFIKINYKNYKENHKHKVKIMKKAVILNYLNNY